MDNILPYLVLTLSFAGLIFYLKGFTYKQIFLLMLWGGILLFMLQFLYISIWKEFNLNLWFIKWNLEVNNFIQRVNNYFNKSSVNIWWIGLFALFFSLIIPAMLEEVGKFYFFKKISFRLGILKSISTCMFAIIYVAMWFAFFETAFYIYFISARLEFKEVFTVTIVRVIISTLSHIFFSAIVWYYFWKSLFMKYEHIDNLEISKTTKLLKKLSHIPFINIHSISKYYKIRYMLTWFVFSILFHSIYNFFMSTHNELWAIITIFVWTVLLVKFITVKKYNKNYIEIKNKIKYLQDMKALKDKMKGSIEK